jgi:4-amino-4-deoxy-L-arabinose transferase-like glycosyltransferase
MGPDAPANPTAAGRGALWVVLGLALAFRLCGLWWGLPSADRHWSFHPDEYRLADAAARVVEEATWHPSSFQYGSLAVYLPALTGAPLAGLGVVEGVGDWHLITRLVSLALGLATVAMVWALGRRLLGPQGALAATCALALAPGHALLSAFATPDVPSGAFVIAALLCTVIALDDVERGGTGRSLWLAAAAGGLAAAVKYGVGLVVLAPIAAALLVRGPERLAERAVRALGLGLLSLGVFAACMPAALWNLSEFLHDLEYELVLHPRAGHDNLFTATGDGWSYHLSTNLPYLLGWPMVLAALAGSLVLVRRGDRRAWIVIGFGALLFVLLGSSQVRFMRYMTPLLPVLAVGVGALATTRLRPLAWAAIAYGGLLSTVQATALLVQDPRDQALARLEERLPEGSAVGTVEVPSFFHPAFVSENGGPKLWKRFRDALARGESPFRFPKATGIDADELVARELDAFVLSEHDLADELRLGEPAAARFIDALEARFPRVESFVGLGPRARRLFDWGVGRTPHDWLYPFLEQRVYFAR